MVCINRTTLFFLINNKNDKSFDFDDWYWRRALTKNTNWHTTYRTCYTAHMYISNIHLHFTKHITDSPYYMYGYY